MPPRVGAVAEPLLPLLAAAMGAAVRGGALVRRLQRSSLTVQHKADATPVTEADTQAQVLIERVLADRCRAIPIVSEEGAIASAVRRQRWEWVWLVDPLDGTKDYIRGGTEYSVNVALCIAGEPCLGVIYAPVRDELFYGVVGWGARRLRRAGASVLQPESGERLAPPPPRRDGPVVVASRSRLSASTLRVIAALRAAYGRVELRRMSSAIKLGLIAAGEADYYPRFGPTMEWDTAAGDALLRAVGGRIVQARTGRPLRYNKRDLHNPPFLAQGAGRTLPRGWCTRRSPTPAAMTTR